MLRTVGAAVQPSSSAKSADAKSDEAQMEEQDGEVSTDTTAYSGAGGPSWTVSRLPKLPFRSEFLRGCVSSSASSRCPRTLARKHVEVVKNIPQEQMFERTGEQIGVIEIPKISGQEGVEAVENIPQERIPVRRCEQSEVIGVTKISSHGPSLLRMVEQMVDVTKISDLGGEGWQRTVKQFLDDTRHERMSRISACTREQRRIVSLFERLEKRCSGCGLSRRVKRRSLKPQFYGTRRKGFSANPCHFSLEGE